MESSKTYKKSFVIGGVAIATYIVNYYLRNMLSVFTPELIAGGYSETHIALLASTYMLLYAGGQILNGFLGDFVSPKAMIFLGLSFAGASIASFAFVENSVLQVVLFGICGFGLSMLRGPLMKTISENTEASHARIICVFFSFASCLGPLIAGLFSIFFDFKWAFILAGSLAVGLAFLSALVLLILEKRGTVKYKRIEKSSLSEFFSVFKIKGFAFYIAIACITEMGDSGISFWIPTYLSSHVALDDATATAVYTLIYAFRAASPFLALFLFKLLKERDILLLRGCFAVALIFFTASIFIEGVVFNLIVLTVGLVAMSCSSALLWSIYIPSLGKTGRVSSANGILDCSGYAASSAANMAFGAMLSASGFGGTVALWAGIGAVGLIATAFRKNN